MKKRLLVPTFLLALLISAGSALAWQHGYGGGMGSCPRFDQGMLKDLSQTQRDDLAALRQKFIDDTYETRNQMMLKRNEMRMLMETSSPDRKKLTELSEDINGLRVTLMDKRIDYVLEAKKIAPELNLGGKFGDNGRRGGCRGMKKGQGYHQQ
ncbi:MAG: periplasmic heavy metal sensor [Desulfobacterales bacterium]|nr:periplasmic heavy metal sensor [Desulfobacterales bacterium]